MKVVGQGCSKGGANDAGLRKSEVQRELCFLREEAIMAALTEWSRGRIAKRARGHWPSRVPVIRTVPRSHPVWRAWPGLDRPA